MLPITLDNVRLFVHIGAAMVWIGGQFTVAVLVPVLRPSGNDTVVAAARRFAWIAWPAYAVLLVSGAWNLIAVDLEVQSNAWLSTLSVKLALVVVSGVAAGAHSLLGARARTLADDAAARRLRAIGGMLAALGLAAAVGAAFFGVQIA